MSILLVEIFKWKVYIFEEQKALEQTASCPDFWQAGMHEQKSYSVAPILSEIGNDCKSD